MDLPELGLDFGGTWCDRFQIGPRRELKLTIWEFDGRPHSNVRFGGIHNFDEVKAVFAPLTHEILHHLRYSRSEPSKPDRLVFDIEFDRWDEPVVIRCSKLQIAAGTLR
ncbi:hypothetical protein [Paludisphaera sp.]|uniref:hypothetical protein n=1 Tax=Paludisphaera sp. TaxID=2017432 RepID=UPI00301D83CB